MQGCPPGSCSLWPRPQEIGEEVGGAADPKPREGGAGAGRAEARLPSYSGHPLETGQTKALPPLWACLRQPLQADGEGGSCCTTQVAGDPDKPGMGRGRVQKPPQPHAWESL